MKANPNAGEDQSYGRRPGRTPVPVATRTSTGTQKGSKGQFSDHESIMVDTSTAARHHFGRIYVTWAKFNGSGRSPIQVAFSDDNGSTGPGRSRSATIAISLTKTPASTSARTARCMTPRSTRPTRRA